MSIPVVDFSAYNLSKKDATEEQRHILSRELKTAFTEDGFVFLKNTGITQEEVDRAMDISKEFFLQPDELKQPFSRKSFANNCNHGWVSSEAERFFPHGPGDLKESFNISSLHPDIKWPSADFQEIHTSLFQRLKVLSLRVVTLLVHSLGLDPEMILSAHRLVGTDENGSTLRPLYYPPVNSEEVKEGQMRCGQHCDFGTITLLLQNNEGLQVRRRSGEFINVPVVPGAVLINVGEMLQRWTCDQFISTPHRVLLSPDGESHSRQTVAFFLYPDDDAVVACLNGSDKYPPVTGRAFLIQGFRRTYGLAEAHNS